MASNMDAASDLIQEVAPEAFVTPEVLCKLLSYIIHSRASKCSGLRKQALALPGKGYMQFRFPPQASSKACWLQGGNNNTYCHDSPLNWLDWNQAEAPGNGYARFFRHLLRFR